MPDLTSSGPQNHILSNDQWSTLTPTIVLTCIATLVVILRLITRSSIVRSIGFDDWVITFSLILSWIVCGLTIGIVQLGISSYVWTSQLDLKPANAKTVLAWNCMYMLLVHVTKASILMQYLRIFLNRTTRLLTYCLLLALLPALLWGILGGVLLCDPVSRLWSPAQSGSCMSLRTYWLSTAAVNIVLDFATVLLPLPAIWRLQMARRQKAGLLLVFLLGFFVCGVSIVRVAIVHTANGHHDWTNASIDAFTWSTVEANTGIVCASCVALKPLFVALFSRFGTEGPETRIPRHCGTLPTIEDDEAADGADDRDHGHGDDGGVGQTDAQKQVSWARGWIRGRSKPTRNEDDGLSSSADKESS